MQEASFILLELGGAFTAAVGVDHGVIVDGLGGTSGPLGARAAGALDGEVAYLAGSISKHLLFGGGAATVAGTLEASAESLAAPTTAKGKLAYNAFIEGAVKAVAALSVSVPHATEVVSVGTFRLSRRRARGIDAQIRRNGCGTFSASSHRLLGGRQAGVSRCRPDCRWTIGRRVGRARRPPRIRQASGTILDHLYGDLPRRCATSARGSTEVVTSAPRTFTAGPLSSHRKRIGPTSQTRSTSQRSSGRTRLAVSVILQSLRAGEDAGGSGLI